MTNIALISLLKPPHEVRMYERIGQSLAKTNKYAINIIGNKPIFSAQPSNNICFTYLPREGRSLIARVINGIFAARIIWQTKPDLVIMTSPELFFYLMPVRLFCRTKLIYDVQEDYYKNILFQGIYPKAIRLILAVITRFSETIFSRFCNSLIAAEKIYKEDIPFCINAITLENKATITPRTSPRHQRDKFHVVFTGTISNYAGITHALHLYGLLKQADSRYHLSVIGHCHSKSIRNQLEKASDTEPSIHLIGLDNHVEHHLIQDTIQSAGLALICYTPNAINRFRVPSKLYEYTQMNVPFVVDVRTHWYRLARDYSGCIGLDFENPDIPFLINSLADHAQFPKLLPIEFSSWQEEEGKLLSLIDSLF